MDTMMLKNVLFSFVVCSLVLSSSAQTCRNYNNFARNLQVFTSCSDLPVLKSFLHWTYDPASVTARIAYRHSGVSSPSSRWVAWGINPTSHGMVGSQALIAYQESDGRMKVYTTPIDTYQTGLQPGKLSFPVSDLSATYNSDDKEITIFATLKLQNFSSTDTLNQVWQEGPVSGGYPGMHDTSGPNVQSMGTLNLLSGQSGATLGSGSSQLRKKNIHGLLNTVSWGIMMPIGALFARYLKVFKAADPAWFYLHAACQVSAYIVGVSGWATGLQLGSQSPGIQFTAHRTIGIVLFCLATIQVSAMLVRPKKEHKHRVYWNMYHHAVGYSIIILGIINIFKGANILNPQKKWESVYVGILVGLGLVAATLEVYTWCVVIKRKNNNKKSQNVDKIPNLYNNGYGSRPHTRV